jgi:hypothetical protein|tara:strand:+ start:608 stop:1453 length:846 start_codon:yes stop_codon:yes gene_type:complete
MASTWVYPEQWAEKLQERLDSPQNFKEVCKVEINNSRVLHNPYQSTEVTAVAHTRGTAYTYPNLVNTDESVTINQSRAATTFIDRADLAQQKYSNQMRAADVQGTVLNEYLETDMLANHGMLTNFDNTELGGGAGNITVSASNIDDIIRGVKRKVRVANGVAMANRHGYFIIWRPADFEILEAFAQANGFNTADRALQNGTIEGFNFMGVDHLVSNSHASGHLMGGVKKLMHLGIVKDTFGQVTIIQDPGLKSGVGIVSRVDWEFKVWTNTKPLVFDILVN